MRRRVALAGLLAAIAALTLGGLQSAFAAEGGPQLVESGLANFPERGFVLATDQKRALPPGAVSVTENGVQVDKPTISPAGSLGGQGIGTVLLIDASNSMRGAAISDAMKAARSFAARNPSQPLAVVTFNDEVATVLPFTVDKESIDAVLGRLPDLAEGTHIYDGTAAAVQVIRDAKLGAGRIVLLSDGADVGSVTTAEQARDAAAEAGVRVYAVGLRSSAFDPVPLQQLAEATGGGYAQASSSQKLAGIYDELGYKLSNEYLITYRSFLGPGEDVKVVVKVDGIAQPLTATYTTPALPEGPTSPYEVPLADRVLQSPVTLVLVVMAVVALLAGAIMMFLRARGDRKLRKRLGQFVTLPADEQARRRKEEVQHFLSVQGDRSFRESRFLSRFSEDCEVADIKTAPGTIVALAVAGSILLALVLALTAGPLFAIFAIAVPLLVRASVSRKLKVKRKAFAEQLPDNLDVLASALRAGHSLVGALSVVVDDAAEPSKSEFRRVVADEQLGVPLDEALEVVVKRMDNQDLDQVAILSGLQRETGGNMAEVLDRVVENVRARMELRRLVQVLTAQGRMARWIVSLLPVGLLVAVTALAPEYSDVLFTETVGQVFLVLAAILVVIGSLVIKKIIDIRL